MKDERRKAEQPEVLVGIDVGSTTTKIVVMQTGNSDYKVVFSNYERHHADQLKSVLEILKKFDEKMPAQKVRVCLTGSGAKPIAESLGVPFAQEVAANAIALQKKYEKVGTAIELGGQDAKMIFFKESETDHMRSVSDMRMNGSCAGGTGAFIDEIASVLKVPVEEFNALAAKGEHVYDISGRCGVYAKTDIQPLLNQGVYRLNGGIPGYSASDRNGLSAFHAIAKQTIGGLAQGLEIESPVAFEGGPLTFNPVLVRVFSERLQLEKEDILIPEHPELMIATGAALSLKEMFAGSKKVAVADILKKLEQIQQQKEEAKKNGTNISLENEEKARPFFASVEEKAAFEKAHENIPLARDREYSASVYRKIVRNSDSSFFIQPLENNAVAVVAVDQGAVYTADGSGGSAGFCNNIAVYPVFTQHFGNLQTLRHGFKLWYGAEILQKIGTFLFCLKSKNSLNQKIEIFFFQFIVHDDSSGLF